MRLGVEDRIHLAVLDYLRVCVPNSVAFHVPNGGLRNITTAARMRKLGVLPGVSDLILLTAKGPFFIEVKGPKGRTTEAQDDFLGWCRALGYGTAIVRSVEDMRLALKAWGVPTREV